MPSRTKDEILKDFIAAWDAFELYLYEHEKNRPKGYTTNMTPASTFDALKAEVEIFRSELAWYEHEHSKE